MHVLLAGDPIELESMILVQVKFKNQADNYQQQLQIEQL
jgi:hypothetical protein